MVIWFIGLSGAGKTTLAVRLFGRLKPLHPNLVLLDGDTVREVFPDVDHTVDGRRRNAERISHLSHMLDRQNIHVIAAVLSIFPEWRDWNRRHLSRYFEIFLDVPMEELRRRDTKGLYAAADMGRMPNVVGVDIEFPRPINPDMTLTAEHQAAGPDRCIDHVLDALPRFDPGQ